MDSQWRNSDAILSLEIYREQFSYSCVYYSIDMDAINMISYGGAMHSRPSAVFSLGLSFHLASEIRRLQRRRKRELLLVTHTNREHRNRQDDSCLEKNGETMATAWKGIFSWRSHEWNLPT